MTVQSKRKQFKYHYDEWLRLGNRYGDLDEMKRLLKWHYNQRRSRRTTSSQLQKLKLLHDTIVKKIPMEQEVGLLNNEQSNQTVNREDYKQIGYHFTEYLRLGNRYGDLDYLHALLTKEKY